MKQPIPGPVVRRLSLYLRQLEAMALRGALSVSSRKLARSLGLTDAQVRKDLAWFGQFGRRGVGYLVGPLIDHLRQILGTDKVQNVVVVGAGDLGRALIRYRGFGHKGFRLVAAFDIDERKIGEKIDGVPIHHLHDLLEVVETMDVRLAILTVPAQEAQDVVNRLCLAGIRGILNFAPATLRMPADVSLAGVDLAGQLEQLSFQVGQETVAEDNIAGE